LNIRWGACALIATLLALPASAHEQAGLIGGLASGILHPLTGLDHLVAMVAVGLWGAELGVPALWLLPIIFPLVMAFGGVLGVMGVPLPVPEVFVAGSGLVLGLAVALRWNPGLRIAAGLVAIFAVFHGHAHGMELPRAANPLGYGVGFVTSTGVLHLCGIGIGMLASRPGWQVVYRGSGGLIAVIGAYFLMRALGVLL
jgi:urease accessory protein